ncbi:Unknown protein, partial [Striga hermonthica]
NHVNRSSLRRGSSSLPFSIFLLSRPLSSTIPSISFSISITPLLGIISTSLPAFSSHPVVIDKLLQISCPNQPLNLIFQMPAVFRSMAVILVKSTIQIRPGPMWTGEP